MQKLISGSMMVHHAPISYNRRNRRSLPELIEGRERQREKLKAKNPFIRAASSG
jgi:hypothetical protein